MRSEGASVFLPRLSATRLRLPSEVSLILWVQKKPDANRSVLLFGIGDETGAQLAVMTDALGAPLVAALGAGTPAQFCRATAGASDVCDGELHSVAIVVELGSGLARLYVDGEPEAATLLSFWRPRLSTKVFAFAPGPRDSWPCLLGRGLTEEELAALKERRMPASAQDDRLLDFAVSLRNTRPGL